MLQGAASSGGNLGTLYGPYDNYVVINKQGVVRYHAALTWPHGNRYHLAEIRGCIDTLVSAVAGVEPEPFSSARLVVAPNPFVGAVDVTWAVPTMAAARLDVFDLSGRLVRGLSLGGTAPGTRRATWDGRDEGGQPVRPGVYLLRGRLDGHTMSRRIVRLH